ncbi:zinc finger, CCHC-type containing protein [Tanacetum coccineum]
MSGKDNTSKINEIGSTTHFQCPILKGANYTTWAIRMQIILEANGLWKMVEPNEKTQADNKKDKTAIAFLYQALSEEQLLQITKHKTAKAIWDALKTRHIGEERVQQARLQTLKSDFEMLHMKEDEAIDTFTAKTPPLKTNSNEMSVEEAIGRLTTFEERIKVKKGKAFEDQDKLLFAKHNDNGRRHHYDDQGGGRYISTT